MRGDYARIQSQVLHHLCRVYEEHRQQEAPEKVAAWRLLLLLPRLLLHRTTRGGEAGARDLRRRVHLFDEGQWRQLLEQARATGRGGRVTQPRSAEELRAAQLRAATALVEEGELSHGARVLRSSGLAPGTADTLGELRHPDLRPQALPNDLPVEPLHYVPQAPVTLNRILFAAVLMQARKGLSAGLGGTRNEYLKLCLEDEWALNRLTDVGEYLARGEVPQAVVEALALSQMTALRKGNGRVRGICAGDTLRRLVAKTLARQYQTRLREAVAPANFGLADRSGTDSLVHMVRALTELDPQCTLISIDGVGAYDHVSRTRMLTELWRQEGLRDLVPFVRMWLGRQSTFVWTDDAGEQHDVVQGEGGEQGDALMPALFCLAMKPALEEIQSRLQPGDVVVAYIDDVYVLTRPERARAVYDMVSEVLERVCGIQVNQGKLVCWNRSGAAAPEEIAQLDTPNHRVWRSDAQPADNGVVVLGAPIGGDAYVAAEGERAAQAEQPLLDGILALDSLQAAWLLLLYCAGPRANYHLRTVPPQQATVYAAEHDRRVLNTLSHLLQWQGGERELWQRQAQLPLRLAGLGVRSSSRTAPAAYWASWADCLQPLTERYPEMGNRLLALLSGAREAAPPCIAAARQAADTLDAAGMQARPGWEALARGARPAQPNPEEVEPGDWQHGWQYYASDPLEQREHTNLLSELRRQGSAGPARLRSCAGLNSSVWLTVCPASPAMRLQSSELLTAMRLRLGLEVPQEDTRCERCHMPLDARGYHRLTCNRTARLHTRHRCLVGAWRQVLVEAGGAIPRRNVERLVRDCNVRLTTNVQRRVDLVVTGLGVNRGLPVLCDVTCVSPVTGAGHARGGSLTVDGGAVEAARRHCRNVDYPEVVASNAACLYSLGVEVFGRWGSDSLTLVRAAARSCVAGLPRRVRLSTQTRLLRRWWGLLGLATQRVVACTITLGRSADLGRDLLERPVRVADLPV